MKTIRRGRAIVFAVKNHYLNPTDDMLYDALGQVFDLCFYGPGYRPLNVLHEDARVAFDEEGPFDAAFIHQYVWHYVFAGANDLRQLKNAQYAPFSVQQFTLRLPRFAKNVKRLPCPKILIGLRTDPYWFPKEYVREFEAFPGFLMTWPAQVVMPMSQLPGLREERFGHLASDSYLDFCKANFERIIPFVHVIGDREFHFIPIEKRKRLVCVAGQRYVMRQRAFDSLRAAGLHPSRGFFMQYFLERVLRLIGHPLFRYKWGIEFLRREFERLISTSLVSYTDGSRARYPVRKYFEIPALGSLLVGDPFHNSRDLGFIDGVHYIACEPGDLPDIVRRVERDRDWGEGIIRSGQAMVRQCHSANAYAEYMYRIWPSISDGTYAGAEWRGGEFVPKAAVMTAP